jgi:hypothetical protein
LQHQLLPAPAKGLPDADLLGPLNALGCSQVDKIDTAQLQQEECEQDQSPHRRGTDFPTKFGIRMDIVQPL